MSDAEFRFDFALETVASSWQQEDPNEPGEEDELNVCESSETVTGGGHSFFETQTRGNAYFTVTDPVKVKQEWINRRRAVKSDIQREVKMLVWKKMHKEK
ncbi:unnamed protein product [Echinostoma caproni]|uniref:PHM7_ext domain-containing protein n=1 Tax=Echinostoma caproni TaxID=27848 RepID=A0A183BDJ3_9TREM|nr:unnamed protein product [Echinostoma caproni]